MHIHIYTLVFPVKTDKTILKCPNRLVHLLQAFPTSYSISYSSSTTCSSSSSYPSDLLLHLLLFHLLPHHLRFLHLLILLVLHFLHFLHFVLHPSPLFFHLSLII